MNTKESCCLREIARDPELLEIGRRAIEDALVDWRDAGIQSPLRNNGFVVKTVEGTPSSIIRFGPEVGLKIALIAIVKHLEQRTIQ